MQVEIFSDVVCPWCYIGKRRFERALAGFEHRDEVTVRWRSFELDPTTVSAPPGGRADYADLLAGKYGIAVDQARSMLASTTETAAAEGLEFHFERAVPSNTFLAHQVLHLAAEVGRQDAVKERFMRGYFTDGAALGDPTTLATLAAEAGLEPSAVRAALSDGRFAGAVRADQADARGLGINGVPFFVVDRRFGISGAQPVDVIAATLERAWSDSRPLSVVTPDGAACGPDGCA
jgi:predicted DsbA family dithiol-disulfide isomerase